MQHSLSIEPLFGERRMLRNAIDATLDSFETTANIDYLTRLAGAFQQTPLSKVNDWAYLCLSEFAHGKHS